MLMCITERNEKSLSEEIVFFTSLKFASNFFSLARIT